MYRETQQCKRFFYLVQSLQAVAIHCVRQNVNIFILFRQDQETLKYFHETHCHGAIDFEEFKSFCYKAWDKPYGFVVINLWDDARYGRYWSNYTDVYTPRSYLDK